MCEPLAVGPCGTNDDGIPSRSHVVAIGFESPAADGSTNTGVVVLNNIREDWTDGSSVRSHRWRDWKVGRGEIAKHTWIKQRQAQKRRKAQHKYEPENVIIP